MLGFALWPPSTTAATPKSWKIAARPSPATTAMTPSGSVARPDAAVPFTRSPVAVAAVNSAARPSRRSRAWLSRFSTLIRDSAPCWRP